MRVAITINQILNEIERVCAFKIRFFITSKIALDLKIIADTTKKSA